MWGACCCLTVPWRLPSLGGGQLCLRPLTGLRRLARPLCPCTSVVSTCSPDSTDSEPLASPWGPSSLTGLLPSQLYPAFSKHLLLTPCTPVPGFCDSLVGKAKFHRFLNIVLSRTETCLSTYGTMRVLEFGCLACYTISHLQVTSWLKLVT